MPHLGHIVNDSMPTHGHEMSTNSDYYITVYGLKMDTEKAVMKVGCAKAYQRVDEIKRLDRLSACERGKPLPFHSHKYVQPKQRSNAADSGSSV